MGWGGDGDGVGWNGAGWGGMGVGWGWDVVRYGTVQSLGIDLGKSDVSL